MKRLANAALVGWLMIAPVATWGHGEAVRGSGGATLNATGAEISDGTSVSVRYDRRVYKLFSDQELLDFRRAQGQDVHQHAREETLFLGVAFGVTDDFEISIQLPLNRFSHFKDNGDDFAVANDTISVTDRSQGLSDLLLSAKYRFFERDDNHLALLFGLKLPTGDIRQRTNAGDIVGTHNQPGSGSIDFQLGAAYTGHLGQDLFGVTADVIARVNSEGAGEFRSGNSIQADLALAYRPHASFVPVVELNFIAQERDIEDNEIKTNSGVSSLFLSLGGRVSMDRSHTLFLVYSLPLWQGLPGIQNEEDYRFGLGYSRGF